MNEVEIVEWWHYRLMEWFWMTKHIIIKKLVNLKKMFWYEKWLTYVEESRTDSEYNSDISEHYITLKEFKQKVLYKI